MKDDRDPSTEELNLVYVSEFLRCFWENHKKCIMKILALQFIIIYLELVFQVLVFGGLNKHFILPIVIAITSGTMIAFLTSIFKSKLNQILTWIFIAGFCLLYCVQLVYHDIFKTFLSLYSIRAVGGDALEFSSQILSAIVDNLYGITLLLLPIPIFAYLMKHVFSTEKESVNRLYAMLGASIFIHILFMIVLPLYGKETYSPYDLYYHTWVQEMGVEQLGLLTATRYDVEQLLFRHDNYGSLETGLVIDSASSGIPNGNEKEMAKNKVIVKQPVVTSVTMNVTPTPTPTPAPIDTSPNVLDIDFAALAEQESNTTIKKMHEYFASSVPTNKNKYTGLFEGFNLILLTAEGFSPYAVDKEITPTLYKLVHEGFVFQNFYTPLWWASTSDGEYVACTSLLPKEGVTSFIESGSNAMPFALGTQFGSLGYRCRAYHNHTYTYYKRHISHPNMGYLYKGVGNGLELTESWPESDLEMMEKTIPEYIKDQPFHTYYMTVSGHMNYTFMGNQMATKNREVVEKLPYSMESKAYLACNVELDRALEKLIITLEEKGIADQTVIALSADHYPYGLEKKKIDELAGREIEENFELYQNHFILWSGAIKKPIIIDKACSSLDILPTLYNLFGISYDSRLFMGRDILSDAEPLVIFSNRSFINDKVSYNSTTKEIIKFTGEELPDNYIEKLNQIIKNKFLISESILEKDYYRYILP